MQNVYTKEKELENTGSTREKRGGDYISSMIDQGEQKIKSTVSDIEKKVKQGEEQLKHLATTVDKQLHENPWPVVGGVAAACLLLGFIMGSKRNG